MRQYNQGNSSHDRNNFEFGDKIKNLYTSEDHPQHIGTFVKYEIRWGEINPGTWLMLTDEKGTFWEISGDNVELVEKTPLSHELKNAWNRLESARNQITNGFGHLAVGTIEKVQEIIKSHIESSSSPVEKVYTLKQPSQWKEDLLSWVKYEEDKVERSWQEGVGKSEALRVLDSVRSYVEGVNPPQPNGCHSEDQVQPGGCEEFINFEGWKLTRDQAEMVYGILKEHFETEEANEEN